MSDINPAPSTLKSDMATLDRKSKEQYVFNMSQQPRSDDQESFPQNSILLSNRQGSSMYNYAGATTNFHTYLNS